MAKDYDRLLRPSVPKPTKEQKKTLNALQRFMEDQRSYTTPEARIEKRLGEVDARQQEMQGKMLEAFNMLVQRMDRLAKEVEELRAEISPSSLDKPGKPPITPRMNKGG